jgi:UDP-N-acetyl-2-amino-2-deoxyglucuronate dehydrogenase
MSELGHLPALRATTALTPTILIDSDEGRAKSLAQKFGVHHYSTRLADAAERAEAACVVVPHHAHASVSGELIALGLHILIEKPLAVTVAACDSIIQAAYERIVVLEIAMVRRFARTTKFLKEVLENGTFGSARSFKLVSGVGGVWPTKTSYLLNVEQSGGGVLMSNGVHDLDLLSYLFGQPERLQFFADADFRKARRLESDALIEMTTNSGVCGVVELSRTRDLENGLWVDLERAVVRVPLYGDEVAISLPGSPPNLISGRLSDSDAPGSRGQTFSDMLTDQLNDFATAIRDGKPPMVDGLEGRRAIETIERCYSAVLPLDLPWRQPLIRPERA